MVIIKKKNAFEFHFWTISEPDSAYLLADNLVLLLCSLQIYFQSPRFIFVCGRLKLKSKKKIITKVIECSKCL